MSIEYDTYKGRPIIKIPTGEYQGETQYLSMGYKKALAVVDNIDYIRQFVERCERTGENR